MLLDAVRRLLITAVAAWVASTTLAILASEEKPLEPARHASLYAAHETHSDEKVTIAAEPFDSKEKDSVFPVDYSKHNILPLRVVISNDSDQSLQLMNLRIELIPLGKGKDHYGPASWEDISRRVSSEIGRRAPADKPNPAPRGPLGIPLPGGKGKKTKGLSAKEQFDELSFAARAVEPHQSQSGLVFFDVAGAGMPPSQAKLYVTGIRNSNNQELFYFEVPLYPNARNTTTY